MPNTAPMSPSRGARKMPSSTQRTASFTIASDSRSWMSAALNGLRDEPVGVSSYTDSSTPPFLPASS